MQGIGAKNVLSENVIALNGLIKFRRYLGKSLRMCWKCQEDKHTQGGHIKTFAGGTAKFICKDCLDKKGTS